MSDTSIDLLALHSGTRAVAAHRVTRSLLCSAIGVAAFSLLALNVQAEVPAPQRTVSYVDLNLSQQQDAQVLYRRLRSAAGQVCGNPDSKDLRGRQLQRACYAEALASAVEFVDHDNVTALHRVDGRIRLAAR